MDGLSNGAIWALVALGYTLVYGIIELINFAHGEIFMLGAFTSFALYGTFGLTPSTGTGRARGRPAGDARGRHVRERLDERDDREGWATDHSGGRPSSRP